MTELPFHLKTLEPLKGALDIIRYLDEISTPTADSDEICDALDLSDRAFSKAIRRLVTKGYVVMDADQVYRLTEQGQDGAEELKDYDEAIGGGLGVEPADSSDEDTVVETVARRMVVAVPGQLVAGKPNPVFVGVHPASQGTSSNGSKEMVARVSVVNGEPQNPEDLIFSLSNGSTQQSMYVTPSNYTEVRIKVSVFQLGDNPGEIHDSGGLYVDVPVTLTGSSQIPFTAFGTDITITE